MQFDVGITYEYFFKGCPRHSFVLLEVFSEGAQSLVRLQGKALTVAKNISKIAGFFQAGHDFPLAFQSFRTLYDRHYNIKTTYAGTQPNFDENGPWWLDVATAVSYGSHLVTFTEHHIFEQTPSPYIRAVGTLADLIKDVYELYCFELPQQKEGTKVVWKIEQISLLTHRISSLFLTIIAVVSVYQGKDNAAPLLTLFLTTVNIGSHFIQHPHPERLRRVRQLD